MSSELPANPVNAAVETARVMLTVRHQIWLRGSDDEIARAWAPAGIADSLPPDTEIEVYANADGSLNGWRDPASGIAVNQRRFLSTADPGAVMRMICQGSCGLVWVAPAAGELSTHEENCLTCNGPLVLASGPALGHLAGP